MRRLTVIAITALSTLAVTAAVGLAVFSVRKDSDDGFMLLYGKQAAECDAGGGCAMFSLRQIQHVLRAIAEQQRPQQRWDQNS